MSTQAPPPVADTSPLDAVSCHAQTDIGQKREENQDSFGAIENQNFKFYFVCDGMGGVKGGAVASQLAVSTIESALRNEPGEPTVDAIRAAIADANLAIFDCGSADEQLTGMGTTLVGLGFVGTRMLITSVGDSRAYRIRDGEIIQLTEDHTLVMELLRSGSITEEQAVNHPVSHMLTRSLGPTPEITIDCWESQDTPRPGDKYMLCSDGLYNMLGLEELGEVIMSLPPEEAVEELVSLANLRGGHDNITVMLVSIGDDYPIVEAAHTPAAAAQTHEEEEPLGDVLRVEASTGSDSSVNSSPDSASGKAGGSVTESAKGSDSLVAGASQSAKSETQSPAGSQASGVKSRSSNKTGKTGKEAASSNSQSKTAKTSADERARESGHTEVEETPAASVTGGATSEAPSSLSLALEQVQRFVRPQQLQFLFFVILGAGSAYFLGHFHGSAPEAVDSNYRDSNYSATNYEAGESTADTLRRIESSTRSDKAARPSVIEATQNEATSENVTAGGESSVAASVAAPSNGAVSSGGTTVSAPSAANESEDNMVVGPIVDSHAEDRRAQLEKMVHDLGLRLAAFKEPLNGRAGELLRAASADIERISKELDVTRSQIDAATRGLTIWLGRKKRLQTSDPINLASEVAVSSELVREKQNQFNEATWTFLKQSEVLKFNPSDKALEREVADLARQRLVSMRTLIDSVRQAIEAELRKSEKSIEGLTLARVDLESQLDDARRDVEYVKALASSDPRLRDAKQRELQRILEVAQAELDEISRVGASTSGTMGQPY